MTIWEAAFLGLLQGVTEFLPISSSGHLVIAQQLLGLHEGILTFDIFIHFATLLSILIFFGRSLFKVTPREWVLVAIGTIPAAAVGYLFKDQIEAMFASDSFVGWELILTGLINFYIDRKVGRQVSAVEKPAMTEADLKPWQSFVIGITQAVAIIPGISRSGSTVAGAVAIGLQREAAFRFSFLLAIPALLGATILQAKDLPSAELVALPWTQLLVGGVCAFLAGLASISLFRYVINKARLEWFGWYCIVLGAAMVVVL